MLNHTAKIISLLSSVIALQISVALCQTTQTADGSGNAELLAVLPFEIHGLSPQDGANLRHNFGVGLSDSRRFSIMPDVMMTNKLEQSGITKIDSCNTPPCIAQLGKILNVDKVVHVLADRWDQRTMLHIRLIRSSDGALLYDERIDYSGEFNTVLTSVSVEQGRKLSAAFLDKQPNWYLITAAVLIGVGLIYWIFTTWAASSTTQSDNGEGTPAAH
jgi:hypothetical protein